MDSYWRLCRVILWMRFGDKQTEPRHTVAHALPCCHVVVKGRPHQVSGGVNPLRRLSGQQAPRVPNEAMPGRRGPGVPSLSSPTAVPMPHSALKESQWYRVSVRLTCARGPRVPLPGHRGGGRPPLSSPPPPPHSPKCCAPEKSATSQRGKTLPGNDPPPFPHQPPDAPPPPSAAI